MNRLIPAIAAFASALAMHAAADPAPKLAIKALAETKVAQLPAGELYWRIENVGDKRAAEAAAGSWGLVAESQGKVWLFTLGAKGGSTGAGAKVAEVGPIPRFDAQAYLLRINEATGAPGAITSIHSHPGSEAFYVLRGQQTIRGAHRTLRVAAGEAEAGNGADMPMQVSSSGDAELHALVMFVVDANRPFSSPAKLP